jgi:hypothetical protein
MKLKEMAFARRTYDKRQNNVGKEIVYAHDDDVSTVLSNFVHEGPGNGQIPVYIYVSSDDETFFFSGKPITSDRIQKELQGDFIGLEYADRGEVE